MGMKSKIKIGDKFGMLTVIADAGIKNRAHYYTCECSCKNKTINDYIGSNLLKGNTQSCGCITGEQTFYDYCIENNLQEYLNLWDYDKNIKTPKNVYHCDPNKYYFKCPKGIHESEEKCLVSLVLNNRGTIICNKCNSFAQHLIDNFGNDALDRYWDYEKNTVDPWEISRRSGKKVWIKCQKKEYHGSYDISASHFAEGKRCSFCHGSKVHPQDSIGQYLIDTYGKDALDRLWDYDKNQKDPFEISKGSTSQKIWLKCDNNVNYHPSYPLTPGQISTKSNRKVLCQYCLKYKLHHFDSLGYLYPKSLDVWSDKNEKTPYDYAPHSGLVAWWKCNNGIHEDYQRSIDKIDHDLFMCPECAKEDNSSYLQKKVSVYVKKYVDQIFHEQSCKLNPINPKTGHSLLYDNEIDDIKLIIEVHGEQHYRITHFAYFDAKQKGITPEESFKELQWRDRFKEEYAISNGYDYLIIPYWTEKSCEYKDLIDRKIKELLNKQGKSFVFRVLVQEGFEENEPLYHFYIDNGEVKEFDTFRAVESYAKDLYKNGKLKYKQVLLITHFFDLEEEVNNING